jgi:hypothetical protein
MSKHKETDATTKEKYREAFQAEVIKYLNFDDRHKELAEEIAAEAADSSWASEKEGLARSGRLSLAQKAVLAANTCIRHNYTAYDDILIENTLEQSFSFKPEPDTDLRENVTDAVREFIQTHRD